MKPCLPILVLFAAAGCAPRDEVKSDTRQVPPPPRTDVQDTPEVAHFLETKERWGVKTGADPEAGDVRVNSPVQTTVDELTRLERPEGMPKRGPRANDRFPPVETTVYTVDAEIMRYKIETDDQDYHVVIRDYNGNPRRTMVVELADPTVVSRRSPFRDSMAAVRAKFNERFKVTTKWKKNRARALITGVGFFDFRHGQIGLAPNGIELHPVLDVKFYDEAP